MPLALVNVAVDVAAGARSCVQLTRQDCQIASYAGMICQIFRQ